MKRFYLYFFLDDGAHTATLFLSEGILFSGGKTVLNFKYGQDFSIETFDSFESMIFCKCHPGSNAFVVWEDKECSVIPTHHEVIESQKK